MSKVKIDDIEDSIRKKVYTPESFHLELVEMVDAGQASTLIEAIGVFCQDNHLDGAELAHLVDDSLKAKLEKEAIDSKLLRGVAKKQSLPL